VMSDDAFFPWMQPGCPRFPVESPANKQKPADLDETPVVKGRSLAEATRRNAGVFCRNGGPAGGGSGTHIRPWSTASLKKIKGIRKSHSNFSRPFRRETGEIAIFPPLSPHPQAASALLLGLFNSVDKWSASVAPWSAEEKKVRTSRKPIYVLGFGKRA